MRKTFLFDNETTKTKPKFTMIFLKSLFESPTSPSVELKDGRSNSEIDV